VSLRREPSRGPLGASTRLCAVGSVDFVYIGAGHDNPSVRKDRAGQGAEDKGEQGNTIPL
jgi:hypothetical protein